MIYINNLATDLKSNVKLFADTSLFSIVSHPLETSNILTKDLDEIRGWAEQWKMAFNPDLTNKLEKLFFEKNVRNLYILISTLINLWLKKC